MWGRDGIGVLFQVGTESYGKLKSHETIKNVTGLAELWCVCAKVQYSGI